MKKRSLLLSAAVASIIANAAMADTTARDQEVFTLGKITVGSEKTQKIESNTVTSDEMQAKGFTDVGQAISRVPGVTLREGGRRAESQVSIRGFDSRQVTLNLDGIPVYLPYDGNIDLSRYLTGELSHIEVQKSLGSLLLGPNNMGGSINLVSRKPTKAFEGRASYGVEAGERGLFANHATIYVGSRLSDKFYISTGLSRIDKDNFPLSNDFKPAINGNTNTVVQPKGDRVHAQNDSQTLSLKVGYTPNETDEYALNYQTVKGQKQATLYAGAENERPAYWDWPQWDKESFYFLSHTQFGETYVKSRLFLDKFYNRLTSYDDDRFNTVTKGYAFRSQYEDQVYGGNIEVGRQVGQHGLKAALHAKFDEHTERDLNKDVGSLNERWDTYQNEIFSLALEDRIRLSDATALTLGYRGDQYKVTRADDNDPVTKPSSTQNANNLQLKVEHELTGHTLFGGVSLKTRYPSIKELFSYKMGRAIPNAGLKAETATHYELGSLGAFRGVQYQASLFYSDIHDAIESVQVSPNACSPAYPQCSQNQNVGKATHYGAEFMVNIPTSENTRLDLNYAYLKVDLADKKLVPSQSPEQQASVTLNWFPSAQLDLAADVQFVDQRFNNTQGDRKTDAYELLHLRAGYEFNKTFSTQVVLKNALDKNYEVYDGDPMPGRTLWVNLSADF